MSFLKEFREFAMRGNVVDLAVGVIIGAAFGKIVSSLVADIIMPPLGLLIGGIDFKQFAVTLRDAQGDVPRASITACSRWWRNSLARQQAATIPAATANRWKGSLPPWNHSQRAPSIDNALTLRITIFSEAETVPFGRSLEKRVKRNSVGKISPMPKA